MALTHVLAGAAFFAILTPLASVSAPFVLAMWLVGKFAIACSFTCLFVFASELFPTAVRNVCIGLCQTVSQVGGVFAPSLRVVVS